MSVHIVLATTPEQMDEVFRLRHRVFVEQEQLLEARTDGRLMDRFDAFPSTKILLVYSDGRAVGSVRMALDCEAGMPADAYYNFRAHAPVDARLVHVGMLCIEKGYRNPRLTMHMLQMINYVSVSEGATHLAAPVNPAISRLLKRAGLHQVNEPFAEPGFNCLVVPLMMTLADAKPIFSDFARRNRQQDGLRNYERVFYEPGETVIRAGATDDHTYVVIAGSARVALPGSEDNLGTLGEGDWFGEAALMGGEKRDRNVIADTPLVLMRLRADTLQQYRYHHSDEAERALIDAEMP